MDKKIISAFFIITLACFISGCATYSHPRTITAEKAAELDNRYNIIRNASAVRGIIAGGIAGAASSPNKDELAGNAAKWGLAGGAAGYGIGFLITNIMNATEGPDDGKLRETFQDYRNIQLKE